MNTLTLVLILLLFFAFALFAAGGVYMGWTYHKEWVMLRAKPADEWRTQDLLHARGIEIASYVAAVGVLIFGAVVCTMNYLVLSTLEKILTAVS